MSVQRRQTVLGKLDLMYKNVLIVVLSISLDHQMALPCNGCRHWSTQSKQIRPGYSMTKVLSFSSDAYWSGMKMWAHSMRRANSSRGALGKGYLSIGAECDLLF